MEGLPKIVKSRLAQRSSADFADHLDANLLAAFAEQTLLERERAAVAAHLAQCADCRESVALATAAQEPAALPVVTAAKKRNWFLEWRWVGAAAGACCVIAMALQYRVQPPVGEKTNYTVAPPTGAAPAPLSAQPAQQMAAAPKLKVEHLKKTLQLPPPSPSLAQELTPPVVMTQLDASMPEKNTAVVAVRPAEPASSERAKDLTRSGPAQEIQSEPVETARAKKDIATLQAQTGLLPRANSFAQGMVARAPLAKARAVSGVSQPAVLWSINASPASAGNARGVVERSLDAGKTWEVVPLSDDVSFRAVVSVGPEVWAGGTHGALFHSPDGGAHWEQITVAGDGAKLSGTIVNIDARGANLITITTSSGDKWSSSDGGRQWKRL